MVSVLRILTYNICTWTTLPPTINPIVTVKPELMVTPEQLPLFWGPKGVRCTQVCLYLRQFNHLNYFNVFGKKKMIVKTKVHRILLGRALFEFC